MKTIKKMSVLMFVGLSIVTANLAQTSKTRQPTQGNPPHPLVQQVGGHWSANKPAGTTEGYEIHTVKQGDTLWDISRQYLKDPFLWPQIWEANPSINNPHWIYPGDQILIKKVTVKLTQLTAQIARLGWRAYVTNATTKQWPMHDVIIAYRGEWRIEHGFHMLKGFGFIVEIWLGKNRHWLNS